MEAKQRTWTWRSYAQLPQGPYLLASTRSKHRDGRCQRTSMESTLAIRSSLRLATHWQGLEGHLIELRYKGIAQRHGCLDALTSDSSRIWLAANGPATRTFVDHSSGYEGWAADGKFQKQPTHH